MSDNRKSCAASALCRMNKATTISKDVSSGTANQPPSGLSRWENMNHYTQFMDALIQFMTQSFFFMSEVYTSKTGQPLTDNAITNMPADILDGGQRLAKAQEICERIERKIAEVKELERLLGALGTQTPSPATGQVPPYEPLQSAEINAMSEEQRTAKAVEFVDKIESKLKEIEQLNQMLEQLGSPISSPSKMKGFSSSGSSSGTMTEDQKMAKAQEIVTKIEAKMKEIADVECCLAAMGIQGPGAGSQVQAGMMHGGGPVICSDQPICIDGPMSGDQSSARVQELLSRINQTKAEIEQLDKMLEELGSPIPSPSKTKTNVTRGQRAAPSQGPQPRRFPSLDGGRQPYAVYSGSGAPSRGQAVDGDPSCENDVTPQRGGPAPQAHPKKPKPKPKPTRKNMNMPAMKRQLQFDSPPSLISRNGGGRYTPANAPAVAARCYDTPDYLNTAFMEDPGSNVNAPDYLNMAFMEEDPGSNLNTPDYLNMAFVEDPETPIRNTAFVEDQSFGNASRMATYNSSYTPDSGSGSVASSGYSDCECYESSANPSQSSMMGQISTNSGGSENTLMRAYRQAVNAGYQQQDYQTPRNYANYPKRTAPSPVRNAQQRAKRTLPTPKISRRIQQRQAPPSAGEYDCIPYCGYETCQ